MLPGKRPFNKNQITEAIVSHLPGWMKMRDGDSVGYRYLNAVLGEELDLLSRTLSYYTSYTNVVDSPVDALYQLSQVELDYPFSSGYITPLDSNGTSLGFNVIPVNSSLALFSNPLTRLEEDPENTIYPSGLGTINGIEWMSGDPSGLLAVQQNLDPIDPSSTLYYSIKNTTNLVDLIPVSGDALGLDYIGKGENASYDVLMPEPRWARERNFPMGPWITASGESSTPPSGVSVVYSSYVNEENEKIYFYKGFNNPYGSGVYNKADVDLEFEPVSGTIEIFDILNLTTSGTPYPIPSSGAVIYSYQTPSGVLDGIWMYEGYHNPIPEAITPQGVIDWVKENNSDVFTEIIPASSSYVAWEHMREGGYIDDEVFPHSGTFNWIDGTGNLKPTIRFTNATSRYQAEYAHRVADSITQLSNDPKDSFASYSKINGSMFYIGSSGSYQEVPIEPSQSDPIAVRILPTDMRPGAVAKVLLTVNTRRTEKWLNAQTQDKTIQFVQHNMGYTDDFGAY